MKKTMKLGIQQRTARIDVDTLEEREDGDDKSSRTMEISFSSEEPYERYFGIEILGHDKGEVDLSRLLTGRAPLLVDHMPRIDSQIGVIEKVWLKQGTARAKIRFGKGARANEIFDRVKDGELSSVSVGYRINKMRLEEESEENSTYRVTDWTPHEISVVAIPADSTVGFGRLDEGEAETDVEIETKEKTMTPEELEAQKREAERSAPPVAPQPQAAPPIDMEAAQKDWQKKELQRVDDILSAGARFNMRDKADEAIRNNLSAAQFNTVILDALGDKRDDVLAAKAEVGLTKKEKKKYSFVRAMAAAAMPGNAAVQAGSAFEIECSRAAEELYKKSSAGCMIPVDMLREPFDIEKRDLTVGTATAGGHTVSTDLLASSFIEILRKRAVSMRLGARTLMDLEGNIAIPRQTGAATGFWVAESGAVTESQQAFDQVTMSPKTLGAFVDLSRRLLLQSSIDIEAFVRSDLARVIALELDRAALYGSGASNQPTGVANQTGINTGTANFAAADPTFAEVVDCETVVAADDADVGTLAYAIDATMRGAFKTTEKASGTAQFIWEAGNTVNGHRTEVSNQVVDGDVFFGNWDDLIIGMWSGLDLLLDPITGGTAGTLRIIAHQDADIAVRHPESFCLNNDGV